MTKGIEIIMSGRLQNFEKVRTDAKISHNIFQDTSLNVLANIFVENDMFEKLYNNIYYV